MVHADVLSVGTYPELMLSRSLILKRLGCAVVPAASAEEVERLLGSRHFDLVILCHTLEEKERLRAAAAVHHQSPSTNVLVLSKFEGEHVDYADAIAESGPLNLVAAIQELLPGETKPVAHASPRALRLVPHMSAKNS